jgi:DNA-binding XRE family transcriptional regulator
LPFCHLQIKALQSPYPRLWDSTQAAPKAPRTFGEHIKKRRLERHLFQTEVAEAIGVDRASIQNWERGIYEPGTALIPKIIKFLGYDPRTPNAIPR